MINRTEPACLVIADIAGYTGYLAGVELDHAQDILADLTQTVVTGLRPTFRLAKLEGDAAFAYVLAERVDGSQLQDTIEATYFAFRRRLRDIGQASRCECNACIRIPALDLKLVVHHGEIVRQRMAGREELVGRDVILVHRLLKNAIEDATGIRAYAFYTEACVDAAGMDPAAQGLVAHRESIDIIGEVGGWIRDLEAAWSEHMQRERVLVTADDAYAVIAYETAAPPQLAWEYVTSPIRRPQWGAGIERVDEVAAGGRRGTGTVNHCVHGRDAIVEEILDWRPYDYFTVRATLPTPGLPKLLMTDVFTVLPSGGTRVEVRVGRPRRRDQAAFDEMFPMIEPMIRLGADALVPLLAEAVERRAAEAAAGVEPEVPAPAGRIPVGGRA